MINLPTKFEVFRFTHHGDMKGAENAPNGVVRGDPRSSAMSPFDSAYNFLFLFNRNNASILYHSRDSASYLSKFANFTLPHLYLMPPFGVTPFEFRKDFWPEKTRVSGLSCGIVCVILSVAVLIQYWLVMDRQTDRLTDRHTMTTNTVLA